MRFFTRWGSMFLFFCVFFFFFLVFQKRRVKDYRYITKAYKLSGTYWFRAKSHITAGFSFFAFNTKWTFYYIAPRAHTPCKTFGTLGRTQQNFQGKKRRSPLNAKSAFRTHKNFGNQMLPLPMKRPRIFL